MAANGSEKAFCVLTFHECRSVTIVQRQFGTKFGKQPSDNSIRRWYAQFQETGCVCKRKNTGWPSVTEEQAEQVRQAFVQNARKSTVRGSRELGIPQPRAWRILRKRLKLKPYRLMLLQKLQSPSKDDFLHWTASANGGRWFLWKVIFSDECTFHLCRKVNRHNVRIWGTENSKSVVEVARDSPKVNVFFAVSTFKVYGPFFFSERTVTDIAFLDMLTEWLLPQLNEDSADLILQMDGAPPHFHRHVREFLINIYRSDGSGVGPMMIRC